MSSLPVPPAVSPFVPHHLEHLHDVFEGAPLDQSLATFLALGFEEQVPVDLGQDSVLRTWVHPAGLVAAARHQQGAPDSPLYTVRLSGALGWGWGNVQDCGLNRGYAWSDLDACSFNQFNIFCSLERSLPEATLLARLKTIDGLANLAPFDVWEGQAVADRAGSWLFVVGDEDLQQVDNTVGLDGWMPTAPEGLRVFLRHRIERIHSGKVTPPPKPTTKALDYVRSLGRAAGITAPSDEDRAQVSAWASALEKANDFKLDIAVHSTGLTQASVLAFGLPYEVGRKHLKQWVSKAPVEVLRHAMLNQDVHGHTLTSLLLLNGVIDWTPVNLGGSFGLVRRPKPQHELLQEVFDTLIRRAGVETMSKSLSANGNLMGMLMEVVARESIVSATSCRHVMAVVAHLQSKGVPVESAARLPAWSTQASLTQSNGAPISQTTFWAQVDKEGILAPLVARLQSTHLEAAWSDVASAQSQSKPKPRM